MKKRLTVLALLVSVLLVSNANAEEVKTIKVEPRVIQLAHGDPPNDLDNYHKLATLFADKIAKVTNGAVKIEIFPSGQLGSEVSYYSGFKMGTIDMAIMTSNGFSDRQKDTGFFDIPFIFKNAKVARA